MKVLFMPQDVTCEIRPNQSVLEVAQENNIFIKSVCGGVPSCAECRVRVLEGDYNVLPPASNELSLIGTAHFVDRRRLSCQLRCFGDITVDLNEQIAKQQSQLTGKVKTRAGQREESIESHAVKGSILAESRSMLAPQSSSSSQSNNTPAPEARGALDRAPKPQQRQREPQQPRQGQPQQQRQQRPPQQQNRGPQGPRPPQAEGAQVQPQQPRQPQAAQGAPGVPGEKREGASRRRRGGRGRNKNRGGGGAAARPSSGNNSNSDGGSGPAGVS